MAQRCKAINPDVSVTPIVDFYREEAAPTLLAENYDFVIDAIDNIKAKLHLLNEVKHQMDYKNKALDLIVLK